MKTREELQQIVKRALYFYCSTNAEAEDIFKQLKIEEAIENRKSAI